MHSSCKDWWVFILPRLCVFCPTLPVLGASKVDRYRMFCGASATDTQSPGQQSPSLFAHIPYEDTLQLLVPVYVAPLLAPTSISVWKQLLRLVLVEISQVVLLPLSLIKRTYTRPQVTGGVFCSQGIPKHFARQGD